MPIAVRQEEVELAVRVVVEPRGSSDRVKTRVLPHEIETIRDVLEGDVLRAALRGEEGRGHGSEDSDERDARCVHVPPGRSPHPRQGHDA